MNTNQYQGGYVLIMGIVFLGIFAAMSTALTGYVSLHARGERAAIAAKQALALAEAGIDKAAYELNQSPSYTGESNVALGAGRYTVSITSVNSTTKTVTSTGYVPSVTNPIAVKTVKATLSVSDAAVSFRYGVQAGSGGFSLSGGSTINGSVYSNGSINATNGVNITGSATAANPPAVAADQSNATPVPIASCTAATCINFGNAAASQDFAQSFRVSAALPLNSVRLYIKKTSTPANATVRIVSNNNGSPGTTTFLSTTLPASSVTTSFGWVSVSLPATPILDPSETYWLVIDGATNATRYYTIGANTAYGNGAAKVGAYSGTWNNTTPAGLDGYFELYMGGGTSMIGGSTYVGGVNIGTTAGDNAWAHTVTGAAVTGALYCQTGTYNNKSCNTSQGSPTPAELPLSESNIDAWKEDAASGGTIVGNYNVNWAGATLGPKKIEGNLTVNGGGTLTLSGTVWVTGTITVDGGGKVRLAASYGTNDGALISDGPVSLSGGANFAGSGQAGSYPFLITTSACPTAAGCSGANAIDLSGGTGTVALVAQSGTVRINGGSSLKAVTGKQIVMDGGATLIYDAGLISVNFNSGPGGSWEFLPGSYGTE